MDKNRLITYSLLAHINNSGILVKGLMDIFVPLTKRALSKMNKEGIFSGKNISEIQKIIIELYTIDIPVPVLRNILKQISQDLNTEDNKKFVLYNDDAFSIQNYVFDEFELLVEEKKILINEVENLFKEFCKVSNIQKEEYSSIFAFIDKNKVSITKYLSENSVQEEIEDYSTEAQFIDFFKKIPKIYNIIKELYLGSILSTYIEYSTNPIKSEVELLLDTNFIISLIDLNTPESTHSCRKLIEIAKHNGYKLSVLKDTIEEAKRLLLRRAEYFNESFLTKKVNPEDIYNACDRRNLTKTDLEAIADNLQNELNEKYEIYIVPVTNKYVNKAKFSKEYKNLKEFRNSNSAALHDATAIYYVREKRENKRIKAFENVNCWFVNNAINSEYNDFSQCEKVFKNGYQPEIIKVDILLNILWLSNPNAGKQIDGDEIVNVGLSTLVSSTLNESLPKNAIIRELDDNIQKYSGDTLSDEQIVRVATRIANKQIKDIEELNKIAKENKEDFVKRLEVESEKQKELENKRISQIEKIISDLQEESSKIRKQRVDIDSKNNKINDLEKKLKEARKKELEKENEIRKIRRKNFIQKKVRKWRNSSWIEFSISIFLLLIGIIGLLYFSNWNWNEVQRLMSLLKKNVLISSIIAFLGFIFNLFVITSLYNKYRNQANIKSFKEQIEIPDEYQEIIP
ncbi:MAG: hypothetical protein V2I54_14490 [Bacteroidales bacterium]|jgi:hypothetical protein|nr:hypothetical protein [Bacteroidales bacterium]